ncbi:glycine zipper 2TM domain-containing protein [Sessilibacter corallicola]|uniref:glycine zipper 2TM domain-containing protein n=1 Tax=Sessilibacter corallicola TaxID=2904075 RepID=UPI001E5B982D|nr:glycine zipper 2TM domain-containing protein [Sessilibacter corallicola]MCE2027354.1 glycine zipper 2TM domain-containing protein [Sessilibacter corallicola]
MLLNKITTTAALMLVSTLSFGQSTEIFTYPAAGQSQEQMERDRYECYRWAVSTTGTDPATLVSPASTTAPTIVENKNRGDAAKGTIIGTVAGAIIGSTIESRGRYHRRHNNAAGGAVVGAAVGGIIGSSRERNGYQNAALEAKKIEIRQQREQSEYETKISNYTRAFSACMHGRSYTVK